MNSARSLKRFFPHFMYRSLDPEKIIETIERLSSRIDERFPDSGLGRVCKELLTIAVESQATFGLDR